MTDRARFLAHVRECLADDPAIPDLPDPVERAVRSTTELVERTIAEFQRAGGHAERVESKMQAAERIAEILKSIAARRVVRARGPLLDEIAERLDLGETEMIVADAAVVSSGAEREGLRAAQFAADAGVCEIDVGVAETGTLAVLTRPGQGRAVSLLPPVHIAVLEAHKIVFELGALMREIESRGLPPSAATLITGPSKTGDIELVLTKGVHGPGEVYLFVVDDDHQAKS